MRRHRRDRWRLVVGLACATACARTEEATSPSAERSDVATPPAAEVSAVADAGPPGGEPAPTPAATRPSLRQATGLDAPAARRRFAFTPRSLGALDREAAATERGLAASFAKCEIFSGSYDHLGAPAPYFEVLCDHVVVAAVLGSPGAAARDDAPAEPAIVAVRVLAREITPPSGFGVGARYVPLAELNPSLDCRRAALPGAGDLFPADSTVCAADLAPNILYLFRGVTFTADAPPADVEGLRIDEILWLPQASP
ncbi:MAG: hypothetical protein R3A79_26795 [Nannocystaceae bacterium]